MLRPASGTALNALSYSSSMNLFARSPIACVSTWIPLRKASTSIGRNSSALTVKAEELRPMLVDALRKGIQVETHAIGDRANRFILDEYERAFNAVPLAERKIAQPRWRVEHAQIVNPTDIPRFAKLGVIPSMQPSHAIGDLFFA